MEDSHRRRPDHAAEVDRGLSDFGGACGEAMSDGMRENLRRLLREADNGDEVIDGEEEGEEGGQHFPAQAENGRKWRKVRECDFPKGFTLGNL